MAKTLDDILAAQDAAFVKITAIKTVEDSVAALVDHLKSQLADLQSQLDAAIAANDMTKVQAVSDNMDTINAALDAQAAADAVVVGTPAAPPVVPPAPVDVPPPVDTTPPADAPPVDATPTDGAPVG